MNKKVLIFPYSNQLGTTIPSITLANLLESEGYDITFACSGRFKKVVEAKGYKVQYASEVAYSQYREHTNDNNFDFYDEHLVRHLVEEELALIDMVKPDLIVHHNRQTVKLSAAIRKKPLVTMTIATMTDLFAGKYYIPDNHIVAQLWPFGDANSIIPESLVRGIFHWTAKKWCSGFNKVSKYFGLDTSKIFFDLSIGDITVLIETFGLAPIKELPSNFYYLEQDLKSTFGPKHTWIDDIKKAKAAGKRVIFLSMGSSSFTSYPMVIKSLADMVSTDSKYVLISNHCGLEHEYKSRKGFYIEEFISSEEALALADIAVIHGGKNTINECFLAKVPVVGVPEQAEQLWNLKFFEEKKMCAVVTKKTLKSDPNALKQAIENILSSKNMSDKIAEFIKINVNRADIDNHKQNLINAIKNITQ